MASVLLGVDYTVQWRDFNILNTAPVGQEKFSAFTQTLNNNPVPIIVTLSQNPPFFTLGDNLTMRVFMGGGSWRLRKLEDASGQDQVWLIKHEQGHYDLHALLLRDFYWRIRGLMGVPFSSPVDIFNSIGAHRSATLDHLAQLNHDYDTDTGNSQNGSEQWNWWCAIQRARQLHRAPLEKNADGQFLRIELMDALRTAGLTN
jgi:hypothetical protein